MSAQFRILSNLSVLFVSGSLAAAGTAQFELTL